MSIFKIITARTDFIDNSIPHVTINALIYGFMVYIDIYVDIQILAPKHLFFGIIP